MKRKVSSKSAGSKLPAPTLTPEEEQELDFYICCCIEEIQNVLSQNASEKQKKLAEISLKILRNPAETFIKKKQVMRQWFDDYKTKFENKKKQTLQTLNENKCTIKKAEVPTESVFFRKHEFKNLKPAKNQDDSENFSENLNILKTSDNSFKFDF